MSDWKKPHPVWIVGHRGAPRRARENTIASFDWAESFGVDAIEFDLRQTREGEAVVFHDEEIALGSQRIPVRHFTVREIERLTLSSELGDYRIPKLEEVFHRYGRALRYVVEVKVSGGTNREIMARRISQRRRRLSGGRPMPRRLLRRRVSAPDARGGSGDRDEFPLRPPGRPARAGPADAPLSAGRRDRAAQGPRRAGRFSPRRPRRGSRSTSGPWTRWRRSRSSSARASPPSRPTRPTSRSGLRDGEAREERRHARPLRTRGDVTEAGELRRRAARLLRPTYGWITRCVPP